MNAVTRVSPVVLMGAARREASTPVITTGEAVAPHGLGPGSAVGLAIHALAARQTTSRVLTEVGIDRLRATERGHQHTSEASR